MNMDVFWNNVLQADSHTFFMELNVRYQLLQLWLNFRIMFNS